MRKLTLPLLGTLLLVGCFLPILPVSPLASSAYAGDWLHWRGPEQNGVSREKDLPERWSPDPKAADNNLIWKMPYGCRSTPLVMNGRVYIINDADEGVREQERVMCFDADTGKVLWEHRFNVFHTDIVGSRVGWTNLAGDAETGNVYAHGVQGLLFCFNRDGKVVWSHSLTEEYGRVTGYGGRVTTPIVDGDLVIVGMINASWGDQARGSNRYLALDKRTGSPVWWSEPTGQFKGTYYSCAVVAVIGGQRLLITGGADGAVHAIKVRTGEKVWSYPVSVAAINSSPVVAGDRVYITHGEESEGTSTQGRIVCLDASKIQNQQPALVWKVDGIKSGYASPIIHEGRLYVCSDTAKLYCLDGATGKTLWNFGYGRVARGSPVWADGKIYVADVNNRFHILKPGPTRCQELHEQIFYSPSGGSFIETNGSPAIVNGRIYFATRDEIYCIGKKDQKAKADTIPPMPAEAPANPGAKVTHVQVVPADVVLQPGQGVTFHVRGFDANGQFLKEVKANWSLPAPPPPPGAKTSPPPLQGEIGPEGKLTIAKQPPGQQGTVLAKAEGLESRARVRVVPPLPIVQNFDSIPEGRIPAGWVNCQGKFVVTKLKDGSIALKKLANDSRPPLARANAYIALPTLSDYTIQADVQGTQKRNNLPDIGIGANRYTLMLDGNKQQLRILSWEALPRVDKSIHWEWKPDIWYRMRLTVKVDGDKALVRAKAWPRDQSEPTGWSIEFEDPTPNREGSPALYGYATGILEEDPGTEIYYDNVSVTPNK
jgi:outer membrane protein assembly factor BamB